MYRSSPLREETPYSALWWLKSISKAHWIQSKAYCLSLETMQEESPVLHKGLHWSRLSWFPLLPRAARCCVALWLHQRPVLWMPTNKIVSQGTPKTKICWRLWFFGFNNELELVYWFPSLNLLDAFFCLCFKKALWKKSYKNRWKDKCPDSGKAEF